MVRHPNASMQTSQQVSPSHKVITRQPGCHSKAPPGMSPLQVPAHQWPGWWSTQSHGHHSPVPPRPAPLPDIFSQHSIKADDQMIVLIKLLPLTQGLDIHRNAWTTGIAAGTQNEALACPFESRTACAGGGEALLISFKEGQLHRDAAARILTQFRSPRPLTGRLCRTLGLRVRTQRLRCN